MDFDEFRILLGNALCSHLFELLERYQRPISWISWSSNVDVELHVQADIHRASPGVVLGRGWGGLSLHPGLRRGRFVRMPWRNARREAAG